VLALVGALGVFLRESGSGESFYFGILQLAQIFDLWLMGRRSLQAKSLLLSL
jgi:hypothetical protein